MSIPVTNNVIQSQNIALNQVPHTIMTNVNQANNNGIPTAPETGLQQQQQAIHMKSTNNSSADQAQILTKQRLQDIVRETDSTLNLEDEVEEIILGYVDEFVDRCLKGAALIAKNRHVNTIEVKDVQQFLNRNYNMWTPGFGTDELRPYKRSLTTEAHKQRLTLIRKTLKKF